MQHFPAALSNFGASGGRASEEPGTADDPTPAWGEGGAPPEVPSYERMCLYEDIRQAELEDEQEHPDADRGYCFACLFMPHGHSENKDFQQLQNKLDEWGLRSPLIVLRAVQSWYNRRWFRECNKYWLLGSIHQHIIEHRAMPRRIFLQSVQRMTQLSLHHLANTELLRRNTQTAQVEISDTGLCKLQRLLNVSIKLQNLIDE